MRFTFNGKSITVSDKVKNRATSKLSKLEKLLPENTEAIITFSVIKLDNKVEITIPLHKRILRAEVVSDDMFSAIDQVVDKLDRQIVKYKNRLRDKSKRDAHYIEELSKTFIAAQEETAEAEYDIKIVKSKKFALKPMDAEEAVMEMELLGHSFFVFRNAQNDEVNVVYKRSADSYGIIEPEF